MLLIEIKAGAFIRLTMHVMGTLAHYFQSLTSEKMGKPVDPANLMALNELTKISARLFLLDDEPCC